MTDDDDDESKHCHVAFSGLWPPDDSSCMRSDVQIIARFMLRTARHPLAAEAFIRQCCGALESHASTP
jgi:hypothetical protein